MSSLDRSAVAQSFKLNDFINRKHVTFGGTVGGSCGESFKSDVFNFIVSAGTINQVTAGELQKLMLHNSGVGRKRKPRHLTAVISRGAKCHRLFCLIPGI